MNDWPIYNLDLETGEGFLDFQTTSKETQGLERDERASERAESAKLLLEEALEDFESRFNYDEEIFYLFLGGQKAIPYFRKSIAVDEDNKVLLENFGNYPTLFMGEDVPILGNFDRYYLDQEEEPSKDDKKSYNTERLYFGTPLDTSLLISQTHLLNNEEDNLNCEDENCESASPYKV